jgi:PDZ domain-containing protein
VLPRLRPRGLRNRRGDPGRRRPHAQPALIRKLTPGRLLGYGAVLLVVVVGISWIWPSDQFLLLPDKAQRVAPLVEVKGGHDPKGPGGIYFDAIVVQRAKLFERIFPGIHDGATLVDEDAINPPGVSDEEREKEDRREMARSQDIAAAVALQYLGYKVQLTPIGALIDLVYRDSPAAKAGLKPTDIIVSVDGKPVRKTSELRSLIGAHKPGETVRLGIRGAKDLREVRVGTIAGPDGRPLVGVQIEQASNVKLPFPVKIDAGSIGGP